MKPDFYTRNILAVVLGALVLYLLVLKREPAAPKGQGTNSAAGISSSAVQGGGLVDAQVMKEFRQLEARQLELDQTVWKDEMAAQKHEEIFIQLWDFLRHRKDAYEVLTQFPFDSLSLPDLGPPEAHEAGISRRVGQADSKAWTSALFRAQLTNWQTQGFVVDDSEWRQSSFKPGSNGPANSLIEMSVHARKTNDQLRTVIRATLAVSWHTNHAPDGLFYPQAMHVRDLEILQRTGAPPFSVVVNRSIAPPPAVPFIDPLMVQDVDGDGLPDIALGCKNLIFRNRGGGRFDEEPLVPKSASQIGATVLADVDGDGLVDVLGIDKDGVLLYKGNVSGRFVEAGQRVWAAPTPLYNPFALTTGDINRDGRLDVWMAQYKLPYNSGQMPTPYYDANDGFPAYLLVQNDKGVFADRTKSSGLAAKRFRRAYSSTFVDMDGDGDLDLVMVSDFAGLDVFFNDGLGHFRDVTGQTFGETHAFGMSHVVADLNQDGVADLMMIGMDSAVARRLDSLGLGRFEFPQHQAMRPKMAYGNRVYASDRGALHPAPWNDQVARSGWSWGATAFDPDNDGDLDLYIANGHKSSESARDYDRQFWRHDIYTGSSKHDPACDTYFRTVAERMYGAGDSYGGHYCNVLYLHETGPRFVNAGYLLGVALPLDCRNVVSADLDADGRMDLLVASFEEWPQPRQALYVLKNKWPDSRHWIGFHLQGAPGVSPMGAKVTVTVNGGTQVRHILSGDSYRSQHPATAHFGLGNATVIDSASVQWPNGVRQVMERPVVDQYHVVKALGSPTP